MRFRERCYDASMTTMTTSNVRELVEREVPRLIDIRHDLHAHPELGYQEQRTSEVVQRELKAMGVEFVAGLAGGTGVLAHIPGANEKAIGLRADMDALPIVEETGVAYASRFPGVMHACGHDGHTTMLLGAARVLSSMAKERRLPRPVTFVFQPAEEGGAGGQRMVQDGCLDGSRLGPLVEHMFGLHGWPELALGDVATRVGPMLAASDKFEILVEGTGGHAAYPHFANDAVVAAAAIVTALQQIASRNVGPLDSVVVSITMIHAGTAFNVIPQAVKLGGTVRTLLPEVQTLAIKRLEEIATSIAKAHRCTAKVDYHIGYPVTRNDAAAVAIFENCARKGLGEKHVTPMEQPVMGGEDFAYYCEKVPSCFFALGLLPNGQERMPKLHQPTFDFNDDALGLGVGLFCALALRD
jgi:amidohydrolase